MKGIGLGQFIGQYIDRFTEEMSLADVMGWWSWSLDIGTSLRVGGANEGRRYVEMWFLSGWVRVQCDP